MGKPYSVNLWGSHPDEENDDCHTGDDFATKEEALLVYNQTWRDHFSSGSVLSTTHVEIDGPDLNEVKCVKVSRRQAAEDAEFDTMWRREMAMEAGMGLGIDAYNDAMGYDVED